MVATDDGIRTKSPTAVHRYLVATISNPLYPYEEFNIGPSEDNWEQGPFICGTDLCETFDEVYYSLDMRRLKALGQGLHRYIDVSFVAASCALGEARANFLLSNFFLEEARSNFEKGLYEEVHAIDAPEEGDLDDDDDEEEFIDEEEARKRMGHLVVAFPNNATTNHTRGTERVDFTSAPIRDFASCWSNWAMVRQICCTLPVKCTFRRIAFYREVSGTCHYRYLLLAQVNRLLDYVQPALRSLSNAADDGYGSGDGNGNGPVVGLYREVEFEVDIEALQALVTAAETVKCVGPCLEVKFREEPGAKRTFSRRVRTFKPTKEENDYKWGQPLDANSNYLVRRRTIAYARSNAKHSLPCSTSNSRNLAMADGRIEGGGRRRRGRGWRRAADPQQATATQPIELLDLQTLQADSLAEDLLNNNVMVVSGSINASSGSGSQLGKLGSLLKSSLFRRKGKRKNTQDDSRCADHPYEVGRESRAEDGLLINGMEHPLRESGKTSWKWCRLGQKLRSGKKKSREPSQPRVGKAKMARKVKTATIIRQRHVEIISDNCVTLENY